MKMELTADAFAPFGVVLEPPAEAGRTARMKLPENTRPGAWPTVVLIHLAAASRTCVVTEMERHPHSGQMFLHLSGGGLLIVVAPQAIDGGPDLDRLCVFTSSAGQGFAYHPGIWHAGVSTCDQPARVASLLSYDGSAMDVEVLALPSPITLEI